jgi:hypothetical protein
LSLAQAFISVDSAARIKTYQETWMCNANNISGFFCFFGSIIGFYGAKFENKEYLKTVTIIHPLIILSLEPDDFGDGPLVQPGILDYLCHP